MADERWSQHRFIAFDKTPVFYRRLDIPVPKAVFLIVHGMGEHGGRYQEFAEDFASNSFASFVPDLRGFGQSGGRRGCLGRFEDFFADLDVVLKLLKQRYPGVPVVTLSHSFGGLVTASWLASADKGVKAIILTSPNFGIAIRVPGWRKVLAAFATAVVPDMTQDSRVDGRFLTHDSQIQLTAASDKLIHHRISARLYTELMKWIQRSNETAHQLKLPSLVLQAGDDHIVSKDDTIAFFNELSSPDKELEVYEGLYHEILNETIRPRVYKRVTDWVKSHL